MAKRVYSDQEKAAALAALQANGGNISLTARQLNLPIKTLSNWANGTQPHVSALAEEAGQSLADSLEKIAWDLLKSMPSKIKKATLAQTATAMGIAIDKARLLRGQATAIEEQHNTVDVTQLTVEQLEAIERIYQNASAQSLPK